MSDLVYVVEFRIDPRDWEQACPGSRTLKDARQRLATQVQKFGGLAEFRILKLRGLELVEIIPA